MNQETGSTLRQLLTRQTKGLSTTRCLELADAPDPKTGSAIREKNKEKPRHQSIKIHFLPTEDSPKLKKFRRISPKVLTNQRETSPQAESPALNEFYQRSMTIGLNRPSDRNPSLRMTISRNQKSNLSSANEMMPSLDQTSDRSLARKLPKLSNPILEIALPLSSMPMTRSQRSNHSSLSKITKIPQNS